MPFVKLEITQVASREQKQRIVDESTSILVSGLSKRPERRHMVIDAVADENWGFARLLSDDCRRHEVQLKT